jgi:hypothetical protein
MGLFPGRIYQVPSGHLFNLTSGQSDPQSVIKMVENFR